MRFELEMPDVAACEAQRCAYNRDGNCHARAITVGNSQAAFCDTFLESQQHVREARSQAGVGACKAADCQHNNDLECQAEHIRVGQQSEGIACLTYRP